MSPRKFSLFSVLPILLWWTPLRCQPYSIMELEKNTYTNFEIFLPKGWHEIPDASKSLYIESSDKTKGLYCMAIENKTNKEADPEKGLQYFLIADNKGIGAMEGNWSDPVPPRTVKTKDGIIYTHERLDRTKQYRILTVIISTKFVSARFAFHDYQCSDLNHSRNYFKSSIDSIKLRRAP